MAIPLATSNLIIRIPLDDDQRFPVLRQYFGQHAGHTDVSIYRFMTTLCNEYRGGQWDSYELSNGGFYSAPRASEELFIHWSENSFEGDLTGDAAGIVACLFAYRQMGERTQESRFDLLFRRLQAFACTHPESRLINQAIA